MTSEKSDGRRLGPLIGRHSGPSNKSRGPLVDRKAWSSLVDSVWPDSTSGDCLDPSSGERALSDAKDLYLDQLDRQKSSAVGVIPEKGAGSSATPPDELLPRDQKRLKAIG